MFERSAWLTRRGPPHALWLGRDGLWDHGAMPGWWRPAAPAASAPVPHASFDAWCQAHPGAACGLVLSSWLLHELLLDRALPLVDDSARLAYARSLLQHYHGDDAAEWPLAAWQVAGRRGVSALHGLRLTALQDSARQAGVVLRSVRPWWSLALALARQQVGALSQGAAARLLVVDGALVTQIDLVRGTLERLENRRLGAAATAGPALQTLVDDAPVGACHALGHGLDLPAGLPPGLLTLGPLDGAAPAGWWRLAEIDERRGAQ
jgi:hypothetical protein